MDRVTWQVRTAGPLSTGISSPARQIQRLERMVNAERDKVRKLAAEVARLRAALQNIVLL